MDTKRVLTPTPFQLPKEDDLAVHLLHADVVVLDALEVLLHLVQLVVVGGKERTGLASAVLMQVFHDGPGYADAVVGRGATSQFVKEYQ